MADAVENKKVNKAESQEKSAASDILNITIDDVYSLRYGIPNLSTSERLLVRETRSHFMQMPYSILKSPEDESYLLVFRASKSGNIVIPCKTIEDLRVNLNTLYLNYVAMKLENSDGFLESVSTTRCEIDEFLVLGREGIDISIPRKITETFNKIRDIYMLGNVNKDDDAFCTLEQAEKMEIIDGVCALKNPDEDNVHGKSPEYIDRVQWIRKVEEKFSPEKRREVRSLFGSLKEQILLLKNHPNSYALSYLSLLRADGKELVSEEEAIKRILDKVSVVQENGRLLYDFSEEDIPNEIQDLMLRHLIGGTYDISEKQREACASFKYSSVDINTFLRGKTSVSLLTNKHNFKAMLESIIELERLAASLPKRDFDIVIHRIGLGSSKDITEGAKNLYDSFVSFGTDSGTALTEAQHGAYRYRRILRAEDKAIPLDQICTEVWAERESECEMLLMPFSFTVGKVTGENSKYPDVEMEDIENLDVLKILRLRMENFLKIYNMQSDEKFRRLPKDEEVRQKAYRGYKLDPSLGKQISFEKAIQSLKDSGEYDEFYDFDSSICSDYYQYRGSKLHGFNHTRRVCLNARLIANMEGFSPEDKKVLLFAAKYHDIGRKNDFEDSEHGQNSAEKLEINRLLDVFSDDDKDLIKFIVREHCLSKKQNDFDLGLLPDEKKERYTRMLSVLKDADKLDRVRLGKFDGLDTSRLLLASSKKLVEFSYESFMYLESFIETERGERVAHEVEEVIDELDEYLANKQNSPITITPVSYTDYRTVAREETVKHEEEKIKSRRREAKKVEEAPMTQDTKDFMAAVRDDKARRSYGGSLDRQAIYASVIDKSIKTVGGQRLSKTIKRVIQDGKSKLIRLVEEGTEK